MVKDKDAQIELGSKTLAVLEKKQYRIGAKLNQGAFGIVFKGIKMDTNNNKKEVAIKVIPMERVGQRYCIKFLARELAALMKVQHDNIIQIYDIIRMDYKLFIFMEYANGGDICGVIKKYGAITESMVAIWFSELCHALDYCHGPLNRIAHRDIKLNNVLLHNDVTKLSDFGFACQFWDYEANKPKLSETNCGTSMYYSPQLLLRKPYNPYAADCWAMGVMLFAMLNDRYPFHHKDKIQMNQEQMDPNHLKTRYSKHFPADLVHLQERLLEVEEATRMTMAQALKHPWIIRKGV